MKDDNTGGPAFPVVFSDDDYHSGITTRDYFAAKAMQAELADGIHESDFPLYAGRAYKMADAMMKARAA